MNNLEHDITDHDMSPSAPKDNDMELASTITMPPYYENYPGILYNQVIENMFCYSL